jgi:hypothetical protein
MPENGFRFHLEGGLDGDGLMISMLDLISATCLACPGCNLVEGQGERCDIFRGDVCD